MYNLTKLSKLIKSKTGALLIAGTLVLTPSGVAFAHGGYNDNRRSEDRNKHQNRSAQAEQNRDKKHDKNKDDKRKNHDHEAATCEQRQAAANQKVADYKNKAQQRFNGLSLFLANQQTFVTTNNISIENYAELNQKAEDAKTSASNALAATQAPTIDCNQSEKKDGETIFKSINELHKSMKNYESSVQRLSTTIADKIAVS